MVRIKQIGMILLTAVMLLSLSGCGTRDDAADQPAENFEATAKDQIGLESVSDRSEEMVISIAELTEEPKFYDWTQDGTAMQIIALKNSSGDVQLAYNTCQTCASSPYAYFEYQEGMLVCMNCLNQFSLDSVGRVTGGCNPLPVTDYKQDDENVEISAEELAVGALSFRNWKVFK